MASESAILAGLPDAATAVAAPTRRVGRGGVSFSDDLSLLGGDRLAVRVRITDAEANDAWVVDLRDCDVPRGTPAFSLSTARAQAACALAFGHALGLRGPVEGTRLELLVEPDTWIGARDADDPAAVAFGVARVYDAVLGALANTWPGQVGAGSCSLGAIVTIDARVEVLAGGEGATPSRPGADAWPSPLLTTAPMDVPAWLERRVDVRAGSGGVGARAGGCGVIARYTPTRTTTARVALDRTSNPPHGIDRAGPPAGARVRVEAPGGLGRAVRPWAEFELAAQYTLVVETSGGAGHGFPGWGDIDWDG